MANAKFPTLRSHPNWVPQSSKDAAPLSLCCRRKIVIQVVARGHLLTPPETHNRFHFAGGKPKQIFRTLFRQVLPRVTQDNCVFRRDEPQALTKGDKEGGHM